MLTLAALRYRSILSCHGGPIRRLETGLFPCFGREVVQANAWLNREHRTRQNLYLYSDADGTGTHRSVAVARHVAISEALERWAFHAVVHSERAAEFGFDLDQTSNGMSALPGFRRRTARQKAMLEGVARFCLLACWEGRATGHQMDTDWPGVSAVAIEGPFGGVTAIVHATTSLGRPHLRPRGRVVLRRRLRAGRDQARASQARAPRPPTRRRRRPTAENHGPLRTTLPVLRRPRGPCAVSATPPYARGNCNTMPGADLRRRDPRPVDKVRDGLARGSPTALPGVP
jgi:hypothetical protein